MKKTFILALILLVSTVITFAALNYEYVGSGNKYFKGAVLSNGDIVSVDEFMYDSEFELYQTGTTYPDILLDVTDVSTSSVATNTVTMTELQDVNVSVDVQDANVSVLTVYFNSTDTVGLPVTQDWEVEMSTKYLNKLIVVNTQTTTDYTIVVKKTKFFE